MVRKGVFWTIGEHSYFVYYPIISYLRIKVIWLKEWTWVDSAGIMVSVKMKS